MTTNLSIDSDLLDRALAVSGERTKKAAVTKALQEFIACRQQKRLLDLIGKLLAEGPHSRVVPGISVFEHPVRVPNQVGPVLDRIRIDRLPT
mgnify:CR=1 FL=1